jgi:3-deoxy-manno-octulosonate cytidylyltransferase (CMP-KDO synthetase)
MPTEKPHIIGVIPARYDSVRFPGKVLALIAGKPMIQRVYEQASQAQLLAELFVAVDDARIFDCVTGFGGKAVMTGKHHQSGTDRIAEAVAQLEAGIVVNIQGDHPLIDPQMIDDTIQPLLDHPEIPMATLKTRMFRKEDFSNPNKVRVVTDENNLALYFSRALIPFSRENQDDVEIFEHLGIYVYRKDFLLTFSQWPVGRLEKNEMLEQLRVLEKGYKIYVAETTSPHVRRGSLSVDTPEDLQTVEQFIRENQLEENTGGG